MASELSSIMLDKLRKHFETGVPIERMTFTSDQKKRIQMCMEGYNRLATDPFMDIRAYMRNRFNRTPSELKNDIKLIDYIASFFEGGQKSISKLQVRHASRVLMKNGQDTGNMKALHDGASLLIKLDKLDQPDAPEEMDENMAKMPIVVTVDVGKKFANKKGHDTEEMRRIRKRWGVQQDTWQQQMEERSEIQDVEPISEEEPVSEVEEALNEASKGEMLETYASDLSDEENNPEDSQKVASNVASNVASDDADADDSDDSSEEDEDDFDAEIDAIIAADLKANEERKKKK